eukprot:TRINITY_DN13932_c0_g1_i3.p1 TRINITY_DN13932_c0_g1~~TRINITY_DN13932_c0_g1_i3.p1  ORF type:complete len:713 (+),score=102.39 TRINITY_DN13932_c0_g1_i3:167-2305(+)
MFAWARQNSSKSAGALEKKADPRDSIPLPETLRSFLVVSGISGQGGLLKRSSTFDLETVGTVLGEGNFGVVKLRRDKHTGEPRAVKTCVKPEHWDRGRLVREAEMLQRLDHPHLLRIFGWHEELDTVTMVTEFCPGGELLKAVAVARKTEQLHEGWSAMVFSQLLHAMSYCNDRGIVHRDIKGSNIMLMGEVFPQTDLFKTMPHAMVVDLGLAQVFDTTSPWRGLNFKWGKQGPENIRGTASTMAPEVWSGSFGPKADIWSIGCVLYQLFTSKLPFVNPDPEDQRPESWQRLLRHEVDWVPFLAKSSEEAQQMCQMLLTTDEKARPSAKECLCHKWFERFLSSCPGASDTGIDFDGVVKALVAWKDTTTMHRAVCLRIASECSEVRKFAAIFTQMDLDKNGVLSTEEVTLALRQHGISDYVGNAVVEALDFNGDGCCEYLELGAACLSMLGSEYDNLVWQEFKMLDMMNQGKLNMVCFNRFIEKLKPLDFGRSFTLNDLDTNRDGFISWEEFAAAFGRPGVDYNAFGQSARAARADRQSRYENGDSPHLQAAPSPKAQGSRMSSTEGAPAPKAGARSFGRASIMMGSPLDPSSAHMAAPKASASSATSTIGRTAHVGASQGRRRRPSSSSGSAVGERRRRPSSSAPSAKGPAPVKEERVKPEPAQRQDSLSSFGAESSSILTTPSLPYEPLPAGVPLSAPIPTFFGRSRSGC